MARTFLNRRHLMVPHQDLKDPIYFSLLPATRIFRTLVYPSPKLIDQKLNTGNHEEGSSHLNPQQ